MKIWSTQSEWSCNCDGVGCADREVRRQQAEEQFSFQSQLIKALNSALDLTNWVPVDVIGPTARPPCFEQGIEFEPEVLQFELRVQDDDYNKFL